MHFKGDVLDYLSEPGELWNNSSKLFAFALIVNIQDSSFNILFSTLKTLNENGIALLITIVYNIFNLGLMYYFAFNMSLGVIGLYYGFICSDCLILVALFCYFLLVCRLGLCC